MHVAGLEKPHLGYIRCDIRCDVEKLRMQQPSKPLWLKLFDPTVKPGNICFSAKASATCQ